MKHPQFKTLKSAEAYITDKDLPDVEVRPIYSQDEDDPKVIGYAIFPKREQTMNWKRDPSERPIAHDALMVAALPDDLMTRVFAPHRYSWGTYFPLRATSALNSEGGAGKSTMMLRQQLHGAAGKDYLGMPTREGMYIYFSAEDDCEIVWRRAQKILEQFTPEERTKALQNFRIIDAVGKGLQFVMCSDGMAGVAPAVNETIDLIKQAVPADRPIVQITGDTVSRLNGGAENDSAVMSAVEQAGARIAQAFDCAFVWLHHVAKAVAREGVADVHSGRGGAAFGDNCRSVLRLMPLTWVMVQRQKLDGLDRVEVERGDVLVLIQAKLNQDRRADVMYLRRAEYGLLERITPSVRTDAQTVDQEMQGLVKWFNGAQKQQPFSVTNARDAHLKWTRMTRRNAQTFVEDATRDGRLVEQGKRNGRSLFVPSADALTRQVHRDDNAWLE